MIETDKIYEDTFNKYLTGLKRFREHWLKSSSSWNDELFMYASSDFYFYRFAIERQERNTIPLLVEILSKLMDAYDIKYTPLYKEPFDFIIKENDIMVGYRFEDFYYDENINKIFNDYNVSKCVIIRLWKKGRSNEWIIRDNKRYNEDGYSIYAINVEDFFIDKFDKKEFDCFIKHLNIFIEESKEITGFQSIKVLSSMNFASLKTYEEKMLLEYDYVNHPYVIIDENNKKIEKYLGLKDYRISNKIIEEINTNFIDEKLYKAMLGRNEYAESFLTSEWLYNSLVKRKNFDYTSIISGYLKSIEQMLYKIVMLNINNNCIIAMRKEKEKLAKKSNINILYKNNFPYINFNDNTIEYMDSSIGTFEYFLRYNPKIFIDESLSETISLMVSCFRTECRNGYFHTHNLKNEEIVRKTRENAIWLYFVLLGGISVCKRKNAELGIISSDKFDEICKSIREFRNFNPEFVFEFANGEKLNLIYDFINNTMEFKNGYEHYESLIFYIVDNFSLETYEKLDSNRSSIKVFKLTRDNIPIKIVGFHRNKNEQIIYVKE